MGTTPTVIAIATWSDDAWTLTLDCPFCGLVHSHAGGSDPRHPHCGDRRAACDGRRYRVRSLVVELSADSP